MKIIFSRKGFDAQCGGQPSPVLPDGTLLSLPIPRPHDIVTFKQLFYGRKSYYQIIRELNPNTKIRASHTCHLDPDIRKDIQTPFAENRVSLFGQCDAALTVLKKYEVKENDLFLFFGWFRQTEWDEKGKLRYKRLAPDLHIIYGYLQVGAICDCSRHIPPYANHHAHVSGTFAGKKNNCLYVAAYALSWNKSLPGSGCFSFAEDLVLTQTGMTRSRWKLHSFFKELPIAYHNKTSVKEDYFQSAAQGQEFVMKSNEEVKNWVDTLIRNNFIHL